MNIREAIRILARTGEEVYCKICTVDTVDETARTVDCSPIDESAPLLGVNLQANQDGGSGVVLIPAPGSYVVVAFLHRAAGVVVLTEKIDKIVLAVGKTEAEITDGQVYAGIGGTTLRITREGITLNGGAFGGLVKAEQLTATLNALIDAFNEHTHEVPSSGIVVAGTSTTQVNTKPVQIPEIARKHQKLIQADVENNAIKHG